LDLYHEELSKFNKETLERVKISSVIKQVSTICGKTANNLPSTRIIERMIEGRNNHSA